MRRVLFVAAYALFLADAFLVSWAATVAGLR
jgi:hypothetical protein